MEAIVNMVQRTLIVASGSAAVGCQSRLTKLLADWHGPTATVGLLALESLAHCEMEDVLAAVAAISPPDLSQRLREMGYRLAPEPRLLVLLVVDKRPEAVARANQLLQKIAQWIYAYLGIESGSLLILLEESANALEAATMRKADVWHHPPTAFSLGCCLLGRVNERGLCLSEEVFTSVVGELLYGLVATPLIFELETILTNGMQGVELAITLGLQRYSWRPQQTAIWLGWQWRQQIIGCWLANAPPMPSLTSSVRQWLVEAAIEPQTLVARLGIRSAGEDNGELWPWALRTRLADERKSVKVRHALLSKLEEEVHCHLGDTLFAAKQKVEQRVERSLDEDPNGGVCQNAHWLQAAIDVGNEWLEQLENEASTQTALYVHLHGEQVKLQEEMGYRLAVWPLPTLRSWLWAAIKPWDWPRLIWRYWQLRRQLSRLALYGEQIAKVEVEKVENHLRRQAVAEWVTMLRGVQSRVEEIGDMLGLLRREQEIVGEESCEESGHSQLLEVAVPLYKRLIQDEAAEAVEVATAVGGLGSHLNRLDDEPLRTKLAELAQRRFKRVETMPLSKIWSLVVNNQQLWQRGVEQAACLWCVDEAQLHEDARSEVASQMILMGAELTELMKQEEVVGDVGRWLTTADPRHLWLIRLRRGIHLHNFQKDVEEYEDG